MAGEPNVQLLEAGLETLLELEEKLAVLG